jgi:hypothetical protein
MLGVKSVVQFRSKRGGIRARSQQRSGREDSTPQIIIRPTLATRSVKGRKTAPIVAIGEKSGLSE